MINTAKLHSLARGERLQLLRFVVSFAWADLDVSDAERGYVRKLVARLHLDADDRREVEGWLAVPPSPEEVDPAGVPHEHRQLFIDIVREMVEADGEVAVEELENLRLLEQLTR